MDIPGELYSHPEHDKIAFVPDAFIDVKQFLQITSAGYLLTRETPDLKNGWQHAGSLNKKPVDRAGYDDDDLMRLFYDEVRPATKEEGNYFNKELEHYNNMKNKNNARMQKKHAIDFDGLD
jgi:hypothetical protein